MLNCATTYVWEESFLPCTLSLLFSSPFVLGSVLTNPSILEYKGQRSPKRSSRQENSLPLSPQCSQFSKFPNCTWHLLSHPELSQQLFHYRVRALCAGCSGRSEWKLNSHGSLALGLWRHTCRQESSGTQCLWQMLPTAMCMRGPDGMLKGQSKAWKERGGSKHIGSFCIHAEKIIFLPGNQLTAGGLGHRHRCQS